MNGHHRDFTPDDAAPVWAEVINRNIGQIYTRQELILARLSDLVGLLRRNEQRTAGVSLSEATASIPDKENDMRYQGKTVTSRPAKAGDEGFDPNQDQVVITLPDGTKQTVAKSEVTKD